MHQIIKLNFKTIKSSPIKMKLMKLLKKCSLLILKKEQIGKIYLEIILF